MSFFNSDLLKSGGDIPEGHYEESNMKDTVVPFRNGIMLSIAAGYAESMGAEGLVVAAHSGDHQYIGAVERNLCHQWVMRLEEVPMKMFAFLELFIGNMLKDIALRGQELRGEV